jgi:hypothetical protein
VVGISENLHNYSWNGILIKLELSRWLSEKKRTNLPVDYQTGEE